ncbi:MAG: molybdopterin converting factor subunit 1 [Gammaproteobacteria bacterium]|nr:molybdopterin converting factor subunit 1 [Gammaproteobacteria bacterium]MBQ0838735.1 molybdopterin converting factor subunit 1 [Gammaproteobacteria bacterium]
MIKILFFAQLREMLELESLEFALPDLLSVAQLKKQLADKGGRWQLMFAEQEVLVAVNQVIRDDDYLLKAGDEVAFFPPVTGG